MSTATIPNKDRDEWRQMVTGEIYPQYSNFVLQMKVHQACKDVLSKTVTVAEAIDSIYDICDKYTLAVQNDFKEIFKTW